jgi:hypothetical protein
MGRSGCGGRDVCMIGAGDDVSSILIEYKVVTLFGGAVLIKITDVLLVSESYCRQNALL